MKINEANPQQNTQNSEHLIPPSVTDKFSFTEGSSKMMMMIREANPQEDTQNSEPLLPGLPDEIAKLCLLHLPYPYDVLVRPVSRSWNRAITDPGFHIFKNTLSITLPYIFVLAFQRSTRELQWQALDPRSGRWFVLPPMPCTSHCLRLSGSYACTSLPREGSLFVFQEKWTEDSRPTLLTYRTGTNQWSEACWTQYQMLFLAAWSVGGKIFAAVRRGGDRTVEFYDPATDMWVMVNMMSDKLFPSITGMKMDEYEAAVVGDKVLITECYLVDSRYVLLGESRNAERIGVLGDGVYDAKRNTWEEMSFGMRIGLGWTGLRVVLGERLFMITGSESCSLKVYVPERDMWEDVGGVDFPYQTLKRPFAVCGVEGKIYVVSSGLDVGVGIVSERDDGGEGELWVEWEVVRAPRAFKDFDPSNAQASKGQFHRDDCGIYMWANWTKLVIIGGCENFIYYESVVQVTIMPEDYRYRKDTPKSSSHKCSHCNSYNTCAISPPVLP